MKPTYSSRPVSSMAAAVAKSYSASESQLSIVL
jgi:hypothetical protein